MFFHRYLFIYFISGKQLLLSQLRSIMKGSTNQVRGYSLSCPTFLSEKSCGDDGCRTCSYAYLVRSFPDLVQREDYVSGFERE